MGAAPTAAAQSGMASDEFNSTTLDTSVWSFVNPVGDASVSVSGGRASLSVPAGTNHDLWTGANRAPRLLQAAQNEDFEVEVKFDSAVAARYQTQGLVVEQDADDLLRVDVYHDGSGTRLFAAKMVSGVASTIHQSTVTSGAPVFLRLKRVGDTWTLRHSRDGAAWTTATTFAYAMTVTRAGPFAANAGTSPPSFTAAVDYFRVVGADTNAPILSNIAAQPGTLSAQITWSTDEPATSEVAYGLTSSYGKTVSRSALEQAHALSATGLTCATTYHYEARSADASGNEARSGDRTFTTGPCPTGLSSDEFNSPTLDTTRWSFVDPLGDSQLTMTGSRAVISVPAGRAHDIWSNANNAPRLLQVAPNTDFEVEVKLDAAVARAYQMQGLVVEQDDSNLLRVSVHHDGGGTRLFAASIVNGSASTLHQSTVPDGAPAYLRLERSASTWKMRHSRDGATWSPAVTFSRTMTVRAIGPFAGNGGVLAPAFDGLVDHFRVVPPDVTPPVLSAIQSTTSAIGAQVTWSTDEPATSEVVYGLTTAYGETVSGAALVRDHSQLVHGLSCATTYHFRVRSQDERGNQASSQDRTFTTAPCPTALSSDEFNAPALNTSLWSFADPGGDSNVSVGGGQAVISVPGGTVHDLWTANRRAPRLLQAAPNSDFELEAKFTSAVTAKFQMQGIVVVQDVDDLLRLNVHYDGTRTRLFAAALVGGAATVKHESTIADGPPTFLRLRRTGDSWRLRHSRDGDEWSAAVTFNHTLAVSAVGPFAGNGGGSPPAFSAAVDYFRNVPPDVTPPVISGVAAAPRTIDATLSWETDEPTSSVVAYGPTAGYGTTVTDGSLRRSHSMTVRGLACGTTYHFQVRATDEKGNETRAPNRTLATAPCPAAVRSDEFNSGTLDTSVWSFVDPVGDATLQLTGGRAVISVPQGVAHDIWTGTNRAPRLLQAVPPGAWEVEAKFDSTVLERFQQQGIVVEQDLDDLMRVEVHHDGTGTRLFVAAVKDGIATQKHRSTVPGGAPIYLRLGLVGDRWTLRYSSDGTDWTVATRFTYPFTATAIGPFAGNNAKTTPPAFAAAIDHFRRVPPPPPDTVAPTISAVEAAPRTFNAAITWTTSEYATSVVDLGRTTGYELGAVSVPGDVLQHTIALQGLACATTYHYRVRSTDTAGNAAASGDRTFTTGACSPTDAPVIDVWYGPRQVVGHLGRPQRWFNVLGNVADPDGIRFLDYRLNGGPRTNVSISTGKLRIALPGDFNVELDIDQLQMGDNELELISQDRANRESRTIVTIERRPGQVPTVPYDVNWSSAASIPDVAQVVDGLWKLQGASVRTAALGYDRVIDIGDRSWQDYEVTMPMTIHSLSSTTLHSGAGIGIGWQGHEGDTSPREGWPVGGVCFYYREGFTNPFSLWMLKYPAPHFVGTDGRENSLDLGVAYTWKFRMQRLSGNPGMSRYSCKRWRAATAEPPGWDVSVDLASRAGSVILIADHADVSFGNVSVRPLP
jgi:regulation of enolase protein 1 (concanavalin A-like superfamily)